MVSLRTHYTTHYSKGLICLRARYTCPFCFLSPGGHLCKIEGRVCDSTTNGGGWGLWALSQGMDKSTFLKARVLTHELYNTDHDTFVLHSPNDDKKKQSCD